MNIITCLALTFGLVAMAAGKPTPMKKPRNIVDLTHLFTKDFPYWPGHQKFMLTLVQHGYLGNHGVFVQLNNIQTSEHGGTHWDAPSHFCKQKSCWRTDQVSIDKFIGPGVVINVTEKAAKDPNSGVGIDDLMAWEQRNGEIPKGAIVLMNSGWSKYVNNTKKFLGDDKGNSANFKFPGFRGDATKWLLDNREISAIGVDSVSLDIANETAAIAHRQALYRNVFGIENVNNLDKIPEAGAMIYAFPMNNFNGTGGPMRIVAMWDAAPRHVTDAILICLLTFVALLV